MIVASTDAGPPRKKQPRRALGRRRQRNAVAADAAAFYESPALRDVLRFLTVALSQDAPCVFLIVGESGIGKTMLLRALQTRLLAAYQEVVFHRCAVDLARCEEQLGSIADPAGASHAIYLIDGAERWDAEAACWIEELLKRGVGNGSAARIVITCRSEAEARLRRLIGPVLASNAAFTRLQLQPIPPEYVGEFLRHRLGPSALAGARAWSPEALRQIVEKSSGVPRRIVEQASAMIDAASSAALAAPEISRHSAARRGMARKLMPVAGSTAAMLTIAAALIWLIRPGGQIAAEPTSHADASVPAGPVALPRDQLSAAPVREVPSVAIDEQVAIEPDAAGATSELLEAPIAPWGDDGNHTFEADDFTPELPATAAIMPLPDADTTTTDIAIAGVASSPAAIAIPRAASPRPRARPASVTAQAGALRRRGEDLR